MQKINSIRELNTKMIQWRDSGVTWAFVPTMGALHEGHASLIRKAAERHEQVVVSVFVNPTQFNDAADFEKYPMTPEADAQIAAAAGATVLWTPSASDLYGSDVSAPAVDYGPLTTAFEAADRPGHFDGVVAVVDKLFAAVEPTTAVFGEKDLQQVAVVRRLAKERHPGVEVVCAPLVRDADGLALSSRNVRLTPEGREKALTLSQALQRVAAAYRVDGDLAAALATGRAWVRGVEGLDLAYLEAVQTDTYQTQPNPRHHATHLIIAARVEGIRLIDNIALTGRPEPVIVP
jgi:pantoate--beta-alanine ligase